MRLRLLLATALIAVLAVGAQAQTTPTGTLTGTVKDASGGVLPGVTVTAASPSLQGTRSATTSANGDYIIPFLPAGEYTVTFDLAGFQKQERKIRVRVAESIPLSAQLSVSAITEELTVTAEAPADFTSAPTAAASYKADMIDKLPVGRDIRGAVLLAPGTSDTGPGGNITFSGAMSYEGLFLINGVVANETLRNQSTLLFIEDAVEETKTSTAAISAEYGRFSGGVANMITKSGGNAFSGSFRTTFTNDKWTALTPFEEDLAEDPRSDKVIPTYEATLGGPIFKDKLWFFGAARYEEQQDTATTVYTNISYDNPVEDLRYEGKLTYAINQKHTLKGAYTKRNRKETNNTFGSVMDRDSFYDNEEPTSLLSANYTGVLSNNFFVEAQYSRRTLSFIGSGSRYTDFERGTMILDRSRGSVRWNSPTFCAVCGLTDEQIAAGELNEEKRNNQNVILKGSYFLSTDNSGSHSIVAGFDAFEDSRQNNNYQSGSEYRLNASNTIFRGSGENVTLYPVVLPGRSATDTAASYLLWTPLGADSQGSELRTYSAFLNDQWRFNNKWTFNVGVRWDKVNEKDQAGQDVANGSEFSPRLAASFDVKGDGQWTVNAGLARYIMPVTSGIADLGSGAGRTSSFQFVYMGPAINADLNTANPVPAHDALRQVFDWFFANGGTSRPYRTSPTFVGLTRTVGDDIDVPSTWEYSLGFAGKLGTKGSFRIDGVYRDYDNFYSDQVLPGVQVSDPTGRKFDLNTVVTTNGLERKYKALMGQIQYRFFQDLTLGGNYTLSRSYGNVNNETENSGPVQDDYLAYVEYKDYSWNSPMGDLSIDRRHKLRLWATYDVGLGKAGRGTIGVMQSYNSGRPYSADAAIDTRPYVTNPGYVTPDSSITYYFEGRGAYMTEGVSFTDLSLNYYLPLGISKRSEVFVRFVVDNLFNQSAQDGSGDETVYTASNQNPARTMQAFNPFTTQPVRGTNYELGPNFGKPIEAGDYQTPRSYYFALGFRF
jgi:outer membrane receptor for ferrienterochelin and colicin